MEGVTGSIPVASTTPPAFLDAADPVGDTGLEFGGRLCLSVRTEDRSMLVMVLAAALSPGDLQRWMDDQPPVMAYEARRLSLGLHPPPDDAFRQPPRIPQRAACEGRASAVAAAVALFKVVDGSKLTLTEPDLQAKNDGQPVLQLNDDGKKVRVSRSSGKDI